jgi:hypothetical protein
MVMHRSSWFLHVGLFAAVHVAQAQRAPPPPPSPTFETGCVDTLAWPCWMIGNASTWNKDDRSAYTLSQLCDNNHFTWSGGDGTSTLDAADAGPTLRARDACCVCQPDTQGTPQPQDGAPAGATGVELIVAARRPYVTSEDGYNACAAPSFMSYNIRAGATEEPFPMANSLRGYTWCDEQQQCEVDTALGNSGMVDPGYYLRNDFSHWDPCELAVESVRPPDFRAGQSILQQQVYGDYCEADYDCGIATGALCTGDPDNEKDEDETEEYEVEYERGEEETEYDRGEEEVSDEDRAREEELGFEGQVSSCINHKCYAPPSLFVNPSCAEVEDCISKRLHRLADGTLCNACGAGITCNAEARDDDDDWLIFVLIELVVVLCVYGFLLAAFFIMVSPSSARLSPAVASSSSYSYSSSSCLLSLRLASSRLASPLRSNDTRGTADTSLHCTI